MSELQKRLVVFLLILALLLSFSAFKVLKMVVEKKDKIAGLSQEVTDLTQKGQALSEKLKEREKDLAQAKLDLEDLNYKLEEEKNRSESFEKKYKAEKERGDGLESHLNKVKTSLEEVTREKEKLALNIEKLAEEKEFLSRDLREVRQAKEALEAFVGEAKEEKSAEGIMAKPIISAGRIVSVYPQGLLAIEVEGAPGGTGPGKIVKDEKQIKLSRIHGCIITLEAAEGEDLAGLKKNDPVKYIR